MANIIFHNKGECSTFLLIFFTFDSIMERRSSASLQVAIVPWRHLFQRAEDAIEMSHAVEAAGETDFRDALVGACHQPFRCLYPARLHILRESYAFALLENMREMRL